MNNETTPPAPEAKPVTAAEIVSTDMPPVTGAPAAAPNPETASPETAPKPKAAPIFHNGKEYDPAKWLKNPDGTIKLNKHGHPMPRGGRRPKAAGGAIPPQTPPPSQQSFIPPEPKATAPNNGAETQDNGDAAAHAASMPASSAKSVAEVATNALYTLTGAATGDHKAARPTAAEHANLRDTTAAYIDARGLKFVGGVAIIIGGLAYFLGEQRREQVWNLLKKLAGMMHKPPMKDVTPPRAAPAQPAPAVAAAPAHPSTKTGGVFDF